MDIDARIDNVKIEQDDTIQMPRSNHWKKWLEIEINKWMQSATKWFYALNKSILNNRNISKRTKITVDKVIYRPTLIPGCETWVLNNRQRSYKWSISETWKFEKN